jgi:hypothetical protein
MEVRGSILISKCGSISFLYHVGGLILKVKQVTVEEQLSWTFLQRRAGVAVELAGMAAFVLLQRPVWAGVAVEELIFLFVQLYLLSKINIPGIL